MDGSNHDGPEPPRSAPADPGRFGEDTRSSRYFLLTALVLLILGGAAHVFYAQAGRTNSIHALGTDDAYVSFRYSENLIRGSGLVYNPGERVEGFSNFLHVLLGTALLLIVDRDHLYLAASLVNLMLLAVCLMLFHRLAARRLPPARAPAATLLFALTPSLWAWSASGMETIGVLVRRPDLIVTWIWPDLRAGAGMTRELYLSAGYRIAYLANTTVRSREPNVVDVRDENPEGLAEMIDSGYRLVVLEPGSP